MSNRLRYLDFFVVGLHHADNASPTAEPLKGSWKELTVGRLKKGKGMQLCLTLTG